MKRTGFTLIELMVSMLILVIIVGIVYATFSTVVNSTQASREEAKWLRRKEFLARSFERNFSMAYLDPGAQQPVYEFVGVAGTGPDGPRDSVTFCTSAPLIGGASLPGDLKQVHYELVDTSASQMELGYENKTESQKHGGVIQATETPILGSDLAEQLIANPQQTATGASNTTNEAGSTPPNNLNSPSNGFQNPSSFGNSGSGQFNQNGSSAGTVSPQWSLPEVRSMAITYFDGVKYVEQWDSSTEGRLPWYVDIKINFWKSQDELDQEKQEGLNPAQDPDFEMIIPIAMGMGVTQAQTATALEPQNATPGGNEATGAGGNVGQATASGGGS